MLFTLVFMWCLKTTRGNESRSSQFGKAAIGDLGAASTAAVAASPLIATIDRSIVEAAAKKGTTVRAAFGTCLKEGLFKNPCRFSFAPECRWVMLVYASTYAAANIVDSACEIYDKKSAVPKLVATTTANSATCLAKDTAFARTYGTGTKAVPAVSLALFLLRDVLTIGCAFILPGPIGRTLGPSSPSWLPQLACPVFAQVFTVVPHLLAIDIHNRPGVGPRKRAALISQRARGTLVLRSFRAVPAFGLGVVLNTNLRSSWRSKINPSPTTTNPNI